MSKLSIEDQVLPCLICWRESQTLFHVAMRYGVSEPTASRILRHIEGCLIKSSV
ncbi:MULTISPECIES: helix-turn-helix domain-containing protein [Acinetobacter]|uniref:helix-turn-helix domain-containing protein n=1 Tax=Acinetobacter TaxID=469 RepID=UPI0034DD7ADB